MSLYPTNKHLTDYPWIHPSFPFHVSINEVVRHFPPHRHDFLEFSLVIGGCGVEIINGVRHSLKPGTATFLLPYQVHELYVESFEPLRLYNCMFDMELLYQSLEVGPGLKELLTGEELSAQVHLNEQQTALLAGAFEDMLSEYAGGEVWRMTLLKLKLLESLARFDRMRRKAGEHQVWPPSGNGKKSVWPIIHHIHAHYREPLTLSSVAELFAISSSYLSEEIKRHTGAGFVRFLHEIRIRHACSLLSSTQMPGIDIAIEVGFGSFKSFSRIFRELKAMTPGEYRKAHALQPGGNVGGTTGNLI
ncbi:AraC family transcriptional regulator [Paenibacillus ferrarius]|uniref:AraC family transcriptional regulator n=1 Tax=Paenibacillus ferrarius TaxID=1469647 RepID=UPI003D2AB59A